MSGESERPDRAAPNCPRCGKSLEYIWDGDGYFLEHDMPTDCPWEDDGEELWHD